MDATFFHVRFYKNLRKVIAGDGRNQTNPILPIT